MKLKNSTLLFIGLLILCSGIFLGSYEYFREKKDKVFSDMNILLYESEMPERIDDDVTPQPVEPIDEPGNEQQERNYDYIAVLEINKIGLKRGFVGIDSPYNNVDLNITIIGGSTMPGVKNSSLILAAHSGYCSYCYFDYLYLLTLGDTASVYYNGVKYNYTIVDIYNVEKTGSVTVKRKRNKDTLVLITCTHNSNTEQTVYILELTNTEKY